MQQLLLNIAPPPAPTFDNFVVGKNQEVVDLLRDIALGRAVERFIYIWGEEGSGCTHLLQSVISAGTARQQRAVLIGPDEYRELDELSSEVDIAAIAHLEHLDADGQHSLFNLYNLARDNGFAIVASGNKPPRQLNLREDLTTRIAAGLVYQLHKLSDEQKAQALIRHANARGFDLPSEVVAYLLRHLQRDLPTLLGLLDVLDQYSLQTKRNITIPLLREVLHPE